MAGSQIDFLLSPVLDSNGFPLANGIVYFYESGTSTPKNVYADEELTSLLGTSTTLDANGTCKVFIPTSFVKVVIHNSDDVHQFTYDGLSSVSADISGSFSDFYRLDGSNLITATFNANGQDITNVDDIDAQTFFADHSSAYTPVGGDYFVLGNATETYRLNVEDDNLVVRTDANDLILSCDASSLTLSVDITGADAKFTNINAANLTLTSTATLPTANIGSLLVTSSVDMGGLVVQSVADGSQSDDAATYGQLSVVNSSLSSHTSNTSNPHSTSLSQASAIQGNTSVDYGSNGNNAWSGTDSGVFKTYNLLIKGGDIQFKGNINRRSTDGSSSYYTISTIDNDKLYLTSANANYVMQVETDKKITYSGTPTINSNNDLANKKYVDDSIAGVGGLPEFHNYRNPYLGGTPSTATLATVSLSTFTLTAGKYAIFVKYDHFYAEISHSGTIVLEIDTGGGFGVNATDYIYRGKGGASGHAYNHIAKGEILTYFTAGSDGNYSFQLRATSDAYLQGGEITLIKVAT